MNSFYHVNTKADKYKYKPCAFLTSVSLHFKSHERGDLGPHHISLVALLCQLSHRQLAGHGSRVVLECICIPSLHRASVQSELVCVSVVSVLCFLKY